MADSPEVAVARYAANIALWALWVSGGSAAFTAALFFVELRRRLDEGVKLTMSVIVNAKIFVGIERDDDTYLAITVTNRGSAPTTITHMVLLNYPTRVSVWINRVKYPRFLAAWLYRRFERHRGQHFIVPRTGEQPVPYVLEPGRNWHGRTVHTSDIVQMIEAGRLFVGVSGSHSDKSLYRRVRPWRRPEGAKEA